MKKTTTISKEILVDNILHRSNQKVILHYDLATLYGATVKRVNEPIKEKQKSIFF